MSAAEVLSEAFRIRPATDAEHAFIAHSWRRSFERSSAVYRATPDGYHRFMTAYIGRLMREPNAIARVAVDPADASVVLGFVVGCGPELHYVYVRSELRGHGIARALCESLPISSYTMRTPDLVRRIKPTEREWVFTPRFTL